MKFERVDLLKFVWRLAILLATGCTIRVAGTPTFIPTQLSFVERIAFVHWYENDENSEIYIINADGSDLQYLAKSHLSYTKHPVVWSPNEQYVAFTSVADGIEQIFTIKTDGSNLKQLTFGKSHSYDPVWSPDGKYIAFVAILPTSSTEGEPQIFIMRSDGSHLRQLTFGESRPYVRSYDPSWSPDGNYILFLSNRYDVLDDYGYPEQTAYVMKSDGSEQRPLTNRFVNSISWYPKENLISVSVPDSRYTLNTYIVNLDGTIQSQYPEFTTGGTPLWSPTGEFVLFEHMRVLESTRCSSISVMKPDNLMFCYEIDGLQSSVRAVRPSWSPDGKHIIFSANLDGDYDLYIIKPDGSGLTQLTNMPGHEDWAVWWSEP